MEALWQKSSVCGNRFAAVISFPPSFKLGHGRGHAFVEELTDA
jgi:hypothetical protein